jgi:hypothetical protein
MAAFSFVNVARLVIFGWLATMRLLFRARLGLLVGLFVQVRQIRVSH